MCFSLSTGKLVFDVLKNAFQPHVFPIAINVTLISQLMSRNVLFIICRQFHRKARCVINARLHWQML